MLATRQGLNAIRSTRFDSTGAPACVHEQYKEDAKWYAQFVAYAMKWSLAGEENLHALVSGACRLVV